MVIDNKELFFIEIMRNENKRNYEDCIIVDSDDHFPWKEEKNEGKKNNQYLVLVESASENKIENNWFIYFLVNTDGIPIQKSIVVGKEVIDDLCSKGKKEEILNVVKKIYEIYEAETIWAIRSTNKVDCLFITNIIDHIKNMTEISNIDSNMIKIKIHELNEKYEETLQEICLRTYEVEKDGPTVFSEIVDRSNYKVDIEENIVKKSNFENILKLIEKNNIYNLIFDEKVNYECILNIVMKSVEDNVDMLIESKNENFFDKNRKTINESNEEEILFINKINKEYEKGITLIIDGEMKVNKEKYEYINLDRNNIFFILSEQNNNIEYKKDGNQDLDEILEKIKVIKNDIKKEESNLFVISNINNEIEKESIKKKEIESKSLDYIEKLIDINQKIDIFERKIKLNNKKIVIIKKKMEDIRYKKLFDILLYVSTILKIRFLKEKIKEKKENMSLIEEKYKNLKIELSKQKKNLVELKNKKIYISNKIGLTDENIERKNKRIEFLNNKKESISGGKNKDILYRNKELKAKKDKLIISIDNLLKTIRSIHDTEITENIKNIEKKKYFQNSVRDILISLSFAYGSVVVSNEEAKTIVKYLEKGDISTLILVGLDESRLYENMEWITKSKKVLIMSSGKIKRKNSNFCSWDMSLGESMNNIKNILYLE